MNPGEVLLAIEDLNVTFHAEGRRVDALRGVDLKLLRGTIGALVGESGSGKSVTTRSILGLLPPDRTEVRADSIRFGSEELLHLTEPELRRIRGGRIGMIFQEPAKHLNPAIRIGNQMTEMIRVHLGGSRAAAIERARELLGLVHLASEGDRVLRSFPHELSGGMKQRTMIAMALSCSPELLIADEPTTSLDVTIEREILDLIRSINRKFGMTVLFISHDLGVVREISDTVSVIYAGRIVESASREEIFSSPIHPYTKLLLASIPDAGRRGERLQVISGTVPDAEAVPPGCAFHPRCPFAESECATSLPPTRSLGEGHTAACHLAGKRTLAVDVGGRTL